jgi:hypothetical protein
MSVLHRLSPDHYAKQALAAHYLKRAAEFAQNADDSDAEHWINMWQLASLRQLSGAREALIECGCPPPQWTAEVRKLRADLVPIMVLEANPW